MSVEVQHEVPTRYLTEQAFETSQNIFSDMAEVPAEVNTLDAQILIRYYRRGWQ